MGIGAAMFRVAHQAGYAARRGHIALLAHTRPGNIGSSWRRLRPLGWLVLIHRRHPVRR
jgi:hypothetical protein